jgi:hypothetical protein
MKIKKRLMNLLIQMKTTKKKKKRLVVWFLQMKAKKKNMKKKINVLKILLKKINLNIKLYIKIKYIHYKVYLAL